MFTDSSTGTSISNRRWDFGDGNISNYATATNPSHRYTSAGTYSVNLTVTNAGGSNSQLRSNYIAASALPAAPVAAFTGTPLTGTAPLDVIFIDSSTGTSITNRRWDFGDGNISNYATATNPSHRYISAGTYSVNLTVTGTAGTDSEVKTNYITVPPPSALITITSPNGGEMWPRGTSQTVTWDYTGNPGSAVKIEFLKGGIAFYAENVPLGSGGKGSYTWPIWWAGLPEVIIRSVFRVSANLQSKT